MTPFDASPGVIITTKMQKSGDFETEQPLQELMGQPFPKNTERSWFKNVCHIL